MKATLEFNLPEEEEEFNTALKANAYRSVLCDLDNQLRALLKYDESVTDELSERLLELRKNINELAKDHGIEI